MVERKICCKLQQVKLLHGSSGKVGYESKRLPPLHDGNSVRRPRRTSKGRVWHQPWCFLGKTVPTVDISWQDEAKNPHRNYHFPDHHCIEGSFGGASPPWLISPPHHLVNHWQLVEFQPAVWNRQFTLLTASQDMPWRGLTPTSIWQGFYYDDD